MIQLVIVPSFTDQVLIVMAVFLLLLLLGLPPSTMAMLRCCLLQILNLLKRFAPILHNLNNRTIRKPLMLSLAHLNNQVQSQA